MNHNLWLEFYAAVRALEAYDHSPKEMSSNKTEENMQLCNNANTFDHLINEKVICKLVL